MTNEKALREQSVGKLLVSLSLCEVLEAFHNLVVIVILSKSPALGLCAELDSKKVAYGIYLAL